MYTDLLFLRIY